MNTQDFLQELLNDYNQYYHDNDSERTLLDRRNSFIYKYFFNQKKKDINNITSSPDSFIQGANDLVNGTEIKKSSDLSKILDNSVKIRDNYVLLGIAQIAFEYGWITAQETEAVVMKTRKVKKINTAVLQPDNAEYKTLWQKYKSGLLEKTICDFFNSKGFNVKGSATSEEKKHGSKMRFPDERKERDLIHIYSQFIAFKSSKTKKTDRKNDEHQATAEDYREKARNLMRLICEQQSENNNYKGDIIPVYFDVKLGAGIYLMGKDCFEKSLSEKIKTPCVPCIVYYFADYNSNQNPDCPIYLEKMSNGYSAVKTLFEMNVEMFETVDKAFDAFSHHLVKSDFAEAYQDRNLGLFPSGADRSFNCIWYED